MNRPISKFAEIFGRLATVYTGSNTEPDDFQELLSSGKFVTGLGTGNIYGPGIYAVYDKEKYYTFTGDYGKYIYKLAVDTTGFFSFNTGTIKALYPSLSKYFEMKEISKEEFEKYVGIDDQNGGMTVNPSFGSDSRKVFFEDGTQVPSSKYIDYNSNYLPKTKEELNLRKYDPSKKYFVMSSYKNIIFAQANLLGLGNFEKNFGEFIPDYEPEYTKEIAKSVWRGLYPKVRGLILNGPDIGNTAVIYDYDSSKLLSYNTVDKDTGNLSESSSFNSDKNTEWSASKTPEYMSNYGDYSLRGGEQSILNRVKKNIDIMVDEGKINESFFDSGLFSSQPEYALKKIEDKIKSGDKNLPSELIYKFIEIRMATSRIKDFKNIESIKNIFSELANLSLSYILVILRRDINSEFLETYSEWRENNKNIVLKDYFSFNTGVFTGKDLDKEAFKSNPIELENKISEASKSIDNFKSFTGYISAANQQSSLLNVISTDIFSKLCRDYAEYLAKNDPIYFIKNTDNFPDVSSEVISNYGTKKFSKSGYISKLYPDLINIAILSINKISSLFDLDFLKKDISQQFISSESINKIKDLIQNLLKSSNSGSNCADIDKYNIFSSSNSDIKNILDDLKSYAKSICKESNQYIAPAAQGATQNLPPLPPPPPKPRLFFYYGKGNQNTVTQESIEQVAKYLFEDPLAEHQINIDGVWSFAANNPEIAAKRFELERAANPLPPLPPPPPPPPPQLPPVPAAPPVVQSSEEQAEGDSTEELAKLEASSNFRRIKIARLLLTLKSLGINTLELNRLI